MVKVPFMNAAEGSVRAHSFLTATAAACLAMTLAAGTSDAQTQNQVAGAPHPPARVTVHKRTFLDPGTETRAHAEHYRDYIVSPADGWDPLRNSALFTGQAFLPFYHDRGPMANCLDLPGFCRY